MNKNSVRGSQSHIYDFTLQYLRDHTYDRGEPAVSCRWTGWAWDITGWSAGKLPVILRGIYRIYPHLTKENRRMSTCNRLDLQTLGSQPVMPKILPDHWTTLHHHFGMAFAWPTQGRLVWRRSGAGGCEIAGAAASWEQAEPCTWMQLNIHTNLRIHSLQISVSSNVHRLGQSGRRWPPIGVLIY
jgi:hypothetical protein